MKIDARLRALLLEERDGAAVPRLGPTLVTAGVLLVVALRWQTVAPACLAGIGALLTVAIARRDRFLVGAALLAFGVRALLAAALLWLSTIDSATLRPLQTPLEGGYRFWIFSPDASWYHVAAVGAVDAWRNGTELITGTSAEYVILTAGIYYLFGVSPLNALFVNALFGALAVVAGYRIATCLGGPAAARPAAVLIALWPSAVLWSSQLLKDAACLWLILLILDATIHAAQDPPARSRLRFAARWLALLCVVFAATLVLHRFRHYVLLVLISAPAAFVVHALVRPSRRTPWRIVAAGAVVGVMALAVTTSRHVDFDSMFAPAHPEVAHVNLGVMYQARGDLAAAQLHYEQALQLVPRYPPALKRLGTLFLARNDRARAMFFFERYLAYEPKDAEVRATVAALRSPVVVASAPAPRAQPAPVARPVAPIAKAPEPAAPTPPEAAPARTAAAPAAPAAPATSAAPVTMPGPTGPRRPRPTAPAAPAAPRPAPVVAEVSPPAPASPVTPPPQIASAPPAPAAPARPTPVAPAPAPLPRLAAEPLPVPPSKPFAITGPQSDYESGRRSWKYADAVGSLRRLRAGFVGSSGYSKLDPDVQFVDYRDLLRYLPRALANVWLAPYPWQWADIGGGTGPFKALSAVEAILLYACLIPLVWGLSRMVWRGAPEALYLGVFVLGMTVMLGLVVGNLGTLFRLRLECLLPLFAAGSIGWVWLSRRFRRSS